VPALFPEFFVTFFTAEIKRFSIHAHPVCLVDRDIGVAVGILHEFLPLDPFVVPPALVDTA
jgi:hypothetical protein